MEKVVYSEVPTVEDTKPKGVMPPPYVVADEEALIEDEPHKDTSCTPDRLCLASVLSALCCFWPAALVGMVFSLKARYADSARAQRYMRIAKRSLWVSFIVGAVLMVVVAAVQLAATGHMMKRMYKGAMRGYVAGAYEGETKGAQDAKDLIADGKVAKFPEHIPGEVNFFDISSPFWGQVNEAAEDDFKGVARTFGYSFGWVDGYKKGFCGTENADCAGVNMVALTDYVHCDHMRNKMDRMREKHMRKMMAGEEEGEEEHHMEHAKEHHH